MLSPDRCYLLKKCQDPNVLTGTVLTYILLSLAQHDVDNIVKPAYAISFVLKASSLKYAALNSQRYRKHANIFTNAFE